MAFAGGGALAAAVSQAGGFGLIGGGYGNAPWIDEQLDLAGEARVGVGFITWSAQNSPELIAQAIERGAAAIMLSFGDPSPFAEEVHQAGVPLICQCQSLRHVQDAVDSGAEIVVAQGTEAGGHGSSRGTMSFVPEVADFLAEHAPDTMLLAAGGIADGRGLAASLRLGADGVLIGTRFWASTEALAHPRHQAAMLAANGDETIRTHAPDIVRNLPWPSEFTARVQRNAFIERWHGRDDELASAAATEGPPYLQAFAEGDPDNTAVWFGEAAGLIHEIEPAPRIIERMIDQAERLLK